MYMHLYKYTPFSARVKVPQRNAQAVGTHARQQAKLGSILDQVHSDLVSERTKGQLLYKKKEVINVHSTYMYMLLVDCLTSTGHGSTNVLILFILLNVGQEPPKPLRFLEHVEKPVPRPPTPTVSCPEAELEETEQAVVLLQRVLRGRAIQNKVY